MTELNFLNIRTHNSSKQGGFEELVCQLACLQENSNYNKFVRIEGSGGDGGIECYWQLKDGSIHGWQAKYFINKFQALQFKQLKNSVLSALNNYPKLTKYYICLPRNRTPLQITKLNEKIKEWTKIALNKNINIEFEYWGDTEISAMLQTDEPKFSGRLLYWFDEVILTQNKLQTIANSSKQSLGERYTPELHVDLPIVKFFDAIVSNNCFWKSLERRIKEEIEQFSNIEDTFFKQNKLLDKKILAHLKNIKKVFVEVKERLEMIYKNQDLSNIDSDIIFIECKNVDYKEKHSHLKSIIQENNGLKTLVGRLPDSLYVFLDILKKEYKAIEIAKNQAVLLQGEAGIGKSHLLCDIAIKRLQNNQPTLLLLGQHYTGGNPLDFIKRSLDLSNHSDGRVLGALDALGEAKKNRTLILIDAINEGSYREDWKNHIVGFVSELKKHSHIAVMLSCRTTYKKYIVPDSSGLVEIGHPGFSGVEHKAAEQYLSKQGISKPNTPILLPEFSNPLFLKTCCKALKNSGQTNFPKGMQGIEALFTFYINSIEKIISQKKQYQDGENIVLNALQYFAGEIYPNNVFGIPTQQARDIIESKDTKPNKSDPLFDLLVDENVLSEDMNYSNQKPIYRFTYERFSDYFIAKNLILSFTRKNIDSIFAKKPLKNLIYPQEYYKTKGILSMLSIQIAEKFNKELIDLVPCSKKRNDFKFDYMYGSMFEDTFVNTLLLRAKKSFTKRTRELLNNIPKHPHSHSWEAIDILLQLSTEIYHPWNADFLHKILIKKTMPKRDVLWSIHIATNDYSEDVEESIPVSPLRSLIEWAYSTDLESIEAEQVRLCSIILMWMTSTTNKKVRNQVTKSLVRILSIQPSLLIELLNKFYKVNDAYIVERLYAVAYGVVVNIDNQDIILEVATFVYNKLFKSNEPTPNILIRDYSSSIIKFANHKNLLNDDFIVDNIRPPYQSKWSTEYISEKEIKKICVGEYSRIKSSLMGFPGDFGNYTMNYVHNWSPTPITESKLESNYELQIKFAKTLKNPFKDKLIKVINNNYNNKNTGIAGILEQLNLRDIKDIFKQEIKQLNEEQQETFRWVMGLEYFRHCGAFSRKFTQRWICKRAYELGWKEELFKEFEKSHYVTGECSRHNNKIERIGKKYQWIALYELFAYLADNYHYIDPDYGDADNSQYYGPWQLYKRNIDPTHWIKNTAENKWNKWKDDCWWQPFIYPFAETGDKINDWLWDKEKIPPFKQLLCVIDNNQNEWLVLRGFSDWIKKIKGSPDQIAWYRINSCFVSKNDVAKLKKHFNNKILGQPDLIEISEGQNFLKEYPWHDSCEDMLNRDKNRSFVNQNGGLVAEYLVPVVEYNYSKNSDNSIETPINIYMPSKKLIDAFKLSSSINRIGEWKNNHGDIVFKDPSVYEKGPSTALIEKDALLQYLEEKNLQIIWLVAGEKQVFSDFNLLFGLLYYSGLYEWSNNDVAGSIWFKEEQKD